jgi:hypothetical protein
VKFIASTRCFARGIRALRKTGELTYLSRGAADY